MSEELNSPQPEQPAPQPEVSLKELPCPKCHQDLLPKCYWLVTPQGNMMVVPAKCGFCNEFIEPAVKIIPVAASQIARPTGRIIRPS